VVADTFDKLEAASGRASASRRAVPTGTSVSFGSVSRSTGALTDGTEVTSSSSSRTRARCSARKVRHSHHHRLLAIAKIGRQVLPFLPLMRDADTQITRLVEMHADDAATADRDAGPLATALVVLAAAGPAPGLAAAATDAVQRIQRLLRPAEPLSRVRRQLLRAGAAALALTPVLLTLTPAIVALALGRVPAA
jgi:hypothetical protein